jgi:hypothetical protein
LAPRNVSSARESHSGTPTINRAFVFEEAGAVTVEAVVAAEGQTPSVPFDFRDAAENPTP